MNAIEAQQSETPSNHTKYAKIFWKLWYDDYWLWNTFTFKAHTTVSIDMTCVIYMRHRAYNTVLTTTKMLLIIVSPSLYVTSFICTRIEPRLVVVYNTSELVSQRIKCVCLVQFLFLSVFLSWKTGLLNKNFSNFCVYAFIEFLVKLQDRNV